MKHISEPSRIVATLDLGRRRVIIKSPPQRAHQVSMYSYVHFLVLVLTKSRVSETLKMTRLKMRISVELVVHEASERDELLKQMKQSVL